MKFYPLQDPTPQLGDDAQNNVVNKMNSENKIRISAVRIGMITGISSLCALSLHFIAVYDVNLSRGALFFACVMFPITGILGLMDKETKHKPLLWLAFGGVLLHVLFAS